MVETSSERLADRHDTAVDACRVHSLVQSAVDFADLQARRNDPDMAEGDVGELTAPLCCDTNSAANREDVVAEPLPARVTSGGTLVAAVNGVSAIYLTDDVSKYQCLKNEWINEKLNMLWEKERDLIQSYNKSPYTNRNVKWAKCQHK